MSLNKGFRKQKQYSKKEALEAVEKIQLKCDQLELENAMLKLDIRDRSANFMTQMQVYEGIFRASIESAGTVGELRRWYNLWVKEVNEIDFDAPDHNKQMQDLIDRHGFDIKIGDHHTQIDEIWEGSKQGETK